MGYEYFELGRGSSPSVPKPLIDTTRGMDSVILGDDLGGFNTNNPTMSGSLSWVGNIPIVIVTKNK